MKERPDVAKICGSTAAVAIMIGNKIFTPNIGDSRVIVSRNGEALLLTEDQRAVINFFLKSRQSRPDEQARIKGDGGYIVCGRVLGRLAVTRSFGDFDCKNLEVDGSDGITEVKSFILSEPEVCDFVKI